MAIGDANNDLEMIAFAGLGIAMGNANEQVKAIAQDITDTNENNGVAKAIEKHVFNQIRRQHEIPYTFRPFFSLCQRKYTL